MKLIKTAIIVLFAANISAQCNSCDALNNNGDFETRNNVLGAENASGISQGEIYNWSSSHGTADFFDKDWNWYYLDNAFDSTVGHVCYGSRPTHDHSEGIFTTVDIRNDEDLTYCLKFDYSSYCDSDELGKAHVYMANNLTDGSVNGFKFPTKETHKPWFENAQQLEELTLDAETDIRETGMTTYSKTFKPTEEYTQIWFFTEYLHEGQGFVNCGFMIDNVNISAQTDALTGIEAVQLDENTFEFSPVFSKELDGVTYEWSLENGNKNNGKNITHTFVDGEHEVCLKVTDARGACAEACYTLKVGNKTEKQFCDYSICLSGGGIPSITKLEYINKDGQLEVLDRDTPGFGFPYCIGAWNMCNNGEYELDYLIDDLNLWLQKNNLQGTARKQSVEGETCRGNSLTIMDSELQFTDLYMGDERDAASEETYSFGNFNCNDNETNRPEIDDEIEIAAYPNPTANYINVLIDEDVDHATIELKDHTGNQVELQEKLSSDNQTKFTFDLTSLKSGIYYVNVNTNTSTKSIKVIKI